MFATATAAGLRAHLVVYRNAEGSQRTTRVLLEDGYTTVADIPRILEARGWTVSKILYTRPL